MSASPTKKDGPVKQVSQDKAAWNSFVYHQLSLLAIQGSYPKAYLVMSSLPPESEQLFVLPRHKVDSCILKQGWEHEEQAHCHPNVNGFHIGHLEWGWGRTQGHEGRKNEISQYFCSSVTPPSPPAIPSSTGILGKYRGKQEKCTKKTVQNIGENSIWYLEEYKERRMVYLASLSKTECCV